MALTKSNKCRAWVDSLKFPWEHNFSLQSQGKAPWGRGWWEKLPPVHWDWIGLFHWTFRLRFNSGLHGKQNFYSIRGFVMFPQVSLSVSHDSYLHFGDIVCLYNPSTESTLSANMAESKMHDEKKLVGPCDVSASKSTDPCIRNTFVILGCM